MIACVISATLLGLFAGLAPGPYTTMVAATGLERGFRVALPIAMAPLITDLPAVLVSTLVVQRLDATALTALGIFGGVLIAGIGIRFIRAHHLHALDAPLAAAAHRDAERGSGGPTVQLRHVIATNLLNPAPWIFWFVVAAPLLLIQLRVGPGRGALFLGVLFTVNVSSAATLAWMASHARRLMAPVNQRRVLVGAGATLTLVGVVMVWQALVGDFQAMIDGQRTVRGVLGG